MSNYHYNFHAGLNLVSFPFAKGPDWESNAESRYTPAELFGDEQIITELIGPAEGVNWISPGVWTGNLLDIDPRHSYWVRNVSGTIYEWNFNPELYISKTTHFPIHLGVNYVGFPDRLESLPISEAFTDEDLDHIESIMSEAEVSNIVNRSFVGNLTEFQPGKGYVIRGKNLAPAEPGVEPEKYNLTFFRQQEPNPPETEGNQSRGRYLIVVAEDTDLASFETVYPHMAGKDWGEPTNGGGVADNILKRFSNGILWGNNAGVRSYTEDFKLWPYSRKTHERMPHGDDYQYLAQFPGIYTQPPESDSDDLTVLNSDMYVEPFVNTNFIEYLKSRGFVVDVAVLNRRMRYMSGDWHYTGAHPEDVPDLTVIPYVTEDWSQLRHTHPDLPHWQHSGINTGGVGKFWSAHMLNIHLQYFRNKYKNTAHPLKYVLFLGEPCSMPGMHSAGLSRATQCIPFFGTPSYTFQMDDASDWPYTWYTADYYQSLYKYNFGENGEMIEDSSWTTIEEFNAVMSWNTYDDVITLLEEGFGQSSGELDMYSFVTSTQAYNSLADSDLYPEEWFIGMNSIYEPDFHIGRIMTKEPQNYQDRQRYLMFQLQHTIGYHNFQHLYLGNNDHCVSVNGSWHNIEDEPMLKGYCADSGEPCYIREIDAIWAGCNRHNDGSGTAINDYCESLSSDCGNWDAVEYYKEYLGNSVHIGVNYAGG